MLAKIDTMPEWLAEELSSENVEKRKTTVWQVIKAYRANLRQGTAASKTRAMVASTGKKPYGQKKTGNARRGSFVSSICVGGGKAHGPNPRDHRQDIPVKMARVALKHVLAVRIQSGLVHKSESLDIQTAKTKDAAKIIESVREDRVGKVVVCMHVMNDSSYRAYRNIRGIVLKRADQLTALDVVEAKALILDDNSLENLRNRLNYSNKGA